MKSQLTLWRVLADELASVCHTSATKDIEIVFSRVKDEGLSFLTITLPSFGKSFEQALDQGGVADVTFARFKCDSAGRPLFLRGFLQLIFDESGFLRNINESIIDAIFAVRQLTGVFGKLELECSNTRKLKAFNDFLDTDYEVGRWDEDPNNVLLDYARVSSLLFGTVLSSVEKSILEGDIKPKHGPGATADRLSGNGKYDLVYWPHRLEDEFSYAEFGIPNPRYYSRIDRVNFAPRNQELPSRVLMVPKTLKTPRIIAAEPTALQWIQQAIATNLVPLLEQSFVRGMIGFTDQLPNQQMARYGSSPDGDLATLDMSEASDRVSLLQALALAENFPIFRKALCATRSQLAELTNPCDNSKVIVRLNKFASMGSALCFPIEGMAFLAAVFVGIERKLIAEGCRSRLTKEHVKSLRGSVRVYGDDIIVPKDCVKFVLEVFAQLGWKTNVNKSFWTGLFRESCGGDYYGGTDVTIIRCRQMLPQPGQTDARTIASLVAFRNQLYWRGLWQTCSFLDNLFNRLLFGHYPVVKPTSQLLGRQSVLDDPSIQSAFNSITAESLQRDSTVRWDKMHRPLRKGYVLRSVIPRNEASEVGSLLKCLLASFEEDKHLSYSGRPSVVGMKLKWSPPF
jgi:hypothetical protein